MVLSLNKFQIKGVMMNIAKLEDNRKNVWNNAYRLHQALAQKKIDEQKGVDLYRQHYNDQFNNPTLAGIAMQSIIKKYPVEDSYIYFENMFEIEKNPELNLLCKIAVDKYDRLYPKTGSIREKLINYDRFDYSSNKIKPKMNLLKKLRIKYFPVI